MSAAVAAILEGMPGPRDLRLHQVAGRCVVTAGSRVLFDYDAADTAMRNMAIAALRQPGFQGKRVAAVFGLTENYVATLHRAALREGSVALIGQPRPGRPGKLGAAGREQAAAWRAQGVSDSEIGRRLGVAHTTVARRLGPGRAGTGAPPQPSGAAGAPPQAEPLFPEPDPAAGPEPAAGPDPAAEADPGPAAGTGLVPAPGAELVPVPGAELVPVPGAELVPAAGTGLAPARGAGLVPSGAAAGRAGGGDGRLVAAGAWILEGRFRSRYAGAMLLHAFAGRAGAGEVLAAAAAGQPAGAALLSAVSVCFALGAATIEQVKHLTAADAGPLAGLAVLPDLRTIRPRLAAIADRANPVAVQRLFAAAMLAADPVLSGVYYVDDHFVPYAGARPGKGWNNKRGRAEKGRADAAAAARDQIPAKLPANLIDPDAKVALLRTGRRGLQMMLRLLAHNAEHWLSGQLNAYLRDDDEYRAITRQTIIRGLAGTITYTPQAITVELQQPDEPRITRALAQLIDEINATPPSLPGDHRPITYQLAASSPAFNS